MPGLALISAIHDGHDVVKRAPSGFDECILVTDSRRSAVAGLARGWNVRRHCLRGLNPRMAAKLPKCRPDWFTHCESSVWIDGSVLVHDGGLAALARNILLRTDFVVSEHPEAVDGPNWSARTCLHDEAVFCAGRPKTAGLPVVEQAEHYMASGMPRKWGLWAAGVIGRQHTSRVKELGSAWLLEMERWTVRDQISLPYLLWQRGWEPTTWPFHQRENSLFTVEKHTRRT